MKVDTIDLVKSDHLTPDEETYKEKVKRIRNRPQKFEEVKVATVNLGFNSDSNPLMTYAEESSISINHNPLNESEIQD